MNKELIKQRFTKKLNFYNDNAKIQKQMAEKIIEFLPQKKFNSVFEIGCGTGFLTKLLYKNIEYANYTALDIVSDCYNYINKIDPNIEFLSDDAEEYIKTDNQKYDLIISNAAFQWIEDLPDFVFKLTKMLNQNGFLLFSIFGKENFREIFYILGKSLKYYSKNELNEVFQNFQIKIEEEIRILSFKTPKDVLKHIQTTGVNALAEETWTRQDLTTFETEYNSLCANNPTLTYNPMYVLITTR